MGFQAPRPQARRREGPDNPGVYQGFLCLGSLPLVEPTPRGIRDWLVGLELAGQTKNHLRYTLSIVFDSAKLVEIWGKARWAALHYLRVTTGMSLGETTGRTVKKKRFPGGLERVGIERKGRSLSCHSLRVTSNTMMRPLLPEGVLQYIMGPKGRTMTEIYDGSAPEERIETLLRPSRK